MADEILDEVPDELEIHLAEAVSFNNGNYDSLSLREPTARMVQQAEASLKGGVNVESLRAYQIMLVALVAKVPRGVVEQLPIRKLNQASAFIQGFIDGTGGASGK